MLSSGLKKQLEGVAHEGFVLKRSVFQPCLELYPMEQWKKVMEQVSKLNRFVKKNNDFIRVFTAGVKQVELDATGRLLLPKDLLQYSKIKKEVVLSSVVSVLEIWDKELYENAIEGAIDDFPVLAEQVMGSLNIEEHGVS